MLSKNMLTALTSYNSVYRDGRTLRALQSRKLIKHVRRVKGTKDWEYKWTVLGKQLRGVLLDTPATLHNLLVR